MEEMLLYVAGFGIAGLAYERFSNKNNTTTEKNKVKSSGFFSLFGGGSNLDENRSDPIDLTNLQITGENDDSGASTTPLTLSSNLEEKGYFPVFTNILEAKDNSPTKSVHLIIPGLLPAPNAVWSEGDPRKIYLMPNDSKPHMHGDAPHHMVEWDIDKVFEMYDLKYHSVKNKKIEKYREKKGIKAFNSGETQDVPIETWINWRIPYDSKDYPNLIVKKNSIIWWDFYNSHNLGLVSNEDDYTNNKFDDAILIEDKTGVADEINSSTVVTIMNKTGTYYFVCTIPGHAESGHKIIIKVI